jgi:hypothetical protein
VDSAALGAQVPEEPAVRVAPVLVRQPVLADLLLRLAVPVPVPAHLVLPVRGPVPADPVLEERPVLAHLVLDPAASVDLLLSLLSRPSFSAEMARSTP